ncbi:hypothetical protein [Syntrophomonas palmitatica]|uniref:hypothetical protein n=1 Tax=Syntrophomonas palmitatica TaxID=402877 RepID=UPI0006CFE7EC|nr:hypothetical protein [Syntrophomonas palmitatica]
MLPRDGVIARYIFALCFFLLGSQMVTGWLSAACAILGCVELATALLRYSPLCEIISIYNSNNLKHKSISNLSEEETK